MNQKVLAVVIERAKATHSDGLVIIQDGKQLAQYPSLEEEKPVYIASAGKSLTCLAIGSLLQQGLIDSLDQPICTLFPEWQQGKKRSITIRMLLNHTSGLQDHPNASMEMEPPPDFKVDDVVQLALCAELASDPGTMVKYSNKAVALLAGVVERASGQRFDAFFEKAFYRPMGITDFEWIRDRKGTPTVHGAFVIRPSDLAKFGELMLGQGIYDGKRLVPARFVQEAIAPGQSIDPIWGLLWWRLPEREQRVLDTALVVEWRRLGVSEEFIHRFEPMVGKIFENKTAYWAAVKDLLGADWEVDMDRTLPLGARWSGRIFSDRMLGYYADGYRGNYLVVLPEYHLVAVRCSSPDGFDPESDGFDDFVTLITGICTPAKH
ncbi:MAG: serine hydrolase [Flavobacteriales bacterium]